MNAMRWIQRIVATAATCAMATAASAQAPQITLKVVGQPIQNVLHKEGELPFFNQTLPQLSQGRIKADIVSADQLGISGPEVLRLLSKGVIAFGSGGLTQAVGDSAKFEGCDLPGLTETLDQARVACQAYRPVLAATLLEKFGVKLLALAANPPQAIWCAKPINSLADLKGKKVRVFNQALSDFVAGAGGTALNIPYGDVVPALNNGVIDCAISGTLTGNTSKWFEVTTHLYPMSLGWAIQYWGVNIKKWNALPKDVQATLEGAYRQLEERLWQITAKSTAEGIACNSGKGTCSLGIKANMTVVEVGPAEREKRLGIVRTAVLPAWTKRCGTECTAEWNKVMGPSLHLTLATK